MVCGDLHALMECHSFVLQEKTKKAKKAETATGAKSTEEDDMIQVKSCFGFYLLYISIRY